MQTLSIRRILFVFILAFAAMSGLAQNSNRTEAILVVVGGSEDDEDWNRRTQIASEVIKTAEVRGMTNQFIHVLSLDQGDGFIPIGTPTLRNIEAVIDGLAPAIEHLSLVLIAESETGGLWLNNNEVLPPAQVDGFLDAFQTNGNSAAVIVESSNSGNFLAPCAPTGNQRRVVLTATARNRTANPIPDLSFTTILMRFLRIERTIEDAFRKTRRVTVDCSLGLGQVPEMQPPSIPAIDSQLLRVPTIPRVIELQQVDLLSVPPHWSANPGDPILLGLEFTQKATEVRAFYLSGTNQFSPESLVQETLFDDLYSSFPRLDLPVLQEGTYPVIFVLQASDQLWSPPIFTTLRVTIPEDELSDGGSVEPPSANPEEALTLDALPQLLDLNRPYTGIVTDEVWAQFVIGPDLDFTILIEPTQSHVDLEIDLYRRTTSGNQLIASANQYGPNDSESLQLNDLTAGFYSLRVRRIDTVPGQTRFNLSTYIPVDWTGIWITSVVWYNYVPQIVQKRATLEQLAPSSQSTWDFNDQTILNVSPAAYTLNVDLTNNGARIIPGYSNPRPIKPFEFVYGRSYQTFMFERGVTPLTLVVSEANTGDALDGANIEITTTGPFPAVRTFTTEPDGTTRINVWSGEQQNLVISRAGYFATAKEITGEFNEALTVPVRLSPVPESWKRTYFTDFPVLAEDDTDGDGQTNFEEYHSGTNPIDPDDLLNLSLERIGNTARISWTGRQGINYRVGTASQPSPPTNWTYGNTMTGVGTLTYQIALTTSQSCVAVSASRSAP